MYWVVNIEVHVYVSVCESLCVSTRIGVVTGLRISRSSELKILSVLWFLLRFL